MAVEKILILEANAMFDDLKELLCWIIGMEAVRLMAEMEKSELARVSEGEYGEILSPIVNSNDGIQIWLDDVAKLILTSKGEDEKQVRGIIRAIYKYPELAAKIRSDDDVPHPLRWMAQIRLKKLIECE